MLLAQTFTGYFVEVVKVLAPAVAAIVGVYAGARLAGKREDTLLTKRVEREEAKEHEADELEMRTAARLIDAELYSMQVEFKAAIVIHSYIRLAERITSARFDAYEATLARVADDTTFQAVAGAYNYLDIARYAAQRDGADEDRSGGLRNSKIALELLWLARKALSPIAKPNDRDELAKMTGEEFIRTVDAARADREANQAEAEPHEDLVEPPASDEHQ